MKNIDVGIVRNLCRGFLASPPSALNPSYNSFTRFALSQPRSTERDHKRSVLTGAMLVLMHSLRSASSIFTM